jgi:hypothetical protein
VQVKGELAVKKSEGMKQKKEGMQRGVSNVNEERVSCPCLMA